MQRVYYVFLAGNHEGGAKWAAQADFNGTPQFDARGDTVEEALVRLAESMLDYMERHNAL